MHALVSGGARGGGCLWGWGPRGIGGWVGGSKWCRGPAVGLESHGVGVGVRLWGWVPQEWALGSGCGARVPTALMLLLCFGAGISRGLCGIVAWCLHGIGVGVSVALVLGISVALMLGSLKHWCWSPAMGMVSPWYWSLGLHGIGAGIWLWGSGLHSVGAGVSVALCWYLALVLESAWNWCWGLLRSWGMAAGS